MYLEPLGLPLAAAVWRIAHRGAPVLLLVLACAACAPVPPQNGGATLEATSWRLVKFQGGDGAVAVPEDRPKYTLAFSSGGIVSARIDCNRASGSWKSPGRNQIEFGPLAITRAMCPPGSLHDRIVNHWPYFRSYMIRNGHLFLSLSADGGVYEFEPVR
jgi:para-nitrobenzyl esterase